MKVDVVRVRVRGERISVERLREVPAVRGDLTITDRLGWKSDEAVLIATLPGGPRFEFLIPALDFVRIGKLRGNVFMLKGREEIAHRKRVDVYPQSWRCSLVQPEPIAAWPATHDEDDGESSSESYWSSSPR